MTNCVDSRSTYKKPMRKQFRTYIRFFGEELEDSFLDKCLNQCWICKMS